MDRAVKKVRHVGTRVKQSRKARFGLVGIVNTLVDFTVLNILAEMLGIPVIEIGRASCRERVFRAV